MQHVSISNGIIFGDYSKVKVTQTVLTILYMLQSIIYERGSQLTWMAACGGSFFFTEKKKLKVLE
jgi:hypothetical protein